MAITDILLDQVTGQILVGGGTNEISGLWGTTGVSNVDYGAAATNFDRDDVLDWYDHVRLSKTDGGMFTAVMGDGLWQLCERTPRGTDGTSSAGYTEISMYLLEPTAPHEGRMEREMAYHYKDFAPSGTNDAGLFFKADRIMVWFWGQSLNLEYVPQVAQEGNLQNDRRVQLRGLPARRERESDQENLTRGARQLTCPATALFPPSWFGGAGYRPGLRPHNGPGRLEFSISLKPKGPGDEGAERPPQKAQLIVDNLPTLAALCLTPRYTTFGILVG